MRQVQRLAAPCGCAVILLLAGLCLTACSSSRFTVHGKIDEAVFCPAPGAPAQTLIGKLHVTVTDSAGRVIATTLAGDSKIDSARSRPAQGSCWFERPYSVSISRADQYQFSFGPLFQPSPVVSYDQLKQRGFQLNLDAKPKP